MFAQPRIKCEVPRFTRDDGDFGETRALRELTAHILPAHPARRARSRWLRRRNAKSQ